MEYKFVQVEIIQDFYILQNMKPFLKAKQIPRLKVWIYILQDYVLY